MIAPRDLSDWKNGNRLLVVNFIRILVEVETTFVFDAALMRMIFFPQLYPDSQHIFKMYLRHRNKKKIPSWIIGIKPQLLLINQMKTLKWQPSQTVSESSWSLWRSPPPYLYIIKAWAEFWYFFSSSSSFVIWHLGIAPWCHKRIKQQLLAVWRMRPIRNTTPSQQRPLMSDVL